MQNNPSALSVPDSVLTCPHNSCFETFPRHHYDEWISHIGKAHHDLLDLTSADVVVTLTDSGDAVMVPATSTHSDGPSVSRRPDLLRGDESILPVPSSSDFRVTSPHHVRLPVKG